MIQYFVWICFLGIAPSMANDYCGLCKSHTMCEFKDRSPTCGEHVESGITASEAEEIVFLHNLYRSKIANGSVICGSPGPQPPAANMNALTWDEDLAKVAQRWADQCNFDHDKCRRDARFQVGQNMYVNIGPVTVDWRRAIKSWYSGVLKFNKSTVDSFQSNINSNSYTQLVWANTRYIGCGRTIFETTSNDQENSLKYDKFISSTINGLKNRTSKLSDTDGAKITRQKREYFGEASLNEEAAKGALGSFNPFYITQEAEINQEPLVQSPQSQRYYLANQYGAEEFNDGGRIGGVASWSLGKQPEQVRVYPQSPSYQQPSTLYYRLGGQPRPVQRNYVAHFVPQPERENLYHNDMTSYASNYNGHSGYSRSDSLAPTFTYEIGAVPKESSRRFSEILGDGEYDVKLVTGEDDPESQFEKRSRYIPNFGFINYYSEKSSRAARSVNLENPPNNDDHGDDKTSRSEKVSDKESSRQSVTTQRVTPTRKQILVCNYGPTGNVIDQPIYTKGRLCSECPPNTTCRNGLCSYN